ncbi:MULTISPECIES: halocin C8-like domain-containing protein [Halomicrobium]|nr:MULTISPECIES: halocin C8-like domain-containing protein [Halomicrobium]
MRNSNQDSFGPETMNDRKRRDGPAKSESTGQNSSSGSINRRKVLSGIACSAASLGMLTGTGAAQANPAGFEKTTLEPPKSAKVLGRLKRTDEFRSLRKHVTDELDGKVRFSVAHATVLEVSGEDAAGRKTTKHFAYSPIKGTSGDEAYATIGIDAETEEVIVAGAEVVDRGMTTPEEYPIQFDEVEGKTATVSKEIKLVDATGEEVTTATVTNEDFDRINAGVDSSDSGVSTQGYTCDLCKTAVNAICFATCGAPVWFLCGLIGVGSAGIGGFACGAFIAVVCTLIAVYGCTTRGVDKKICSDRRINIC